MTTEIDRVAETTKFNETYLLKGDVEGNYVVQSVNAHDAGLQGKFTYLEKGVSIFEIDKKLVYGDKVVIAGNEYTIGKTADDYVDAHELKLEKDWTVTRDGIKTVITEGTGLFSDTDKFLLKKGDIVRDADGNEIAVVDTNLCYVPIDESELKDKIMNLEIGEHVTIGKTVYCIGATTNKNASNGDYELFRDNPYTMTSEKFNTAEGVYSREDIISMLTHEAEVALLHESDKVGTYKSEDYTNDQMDALIASLDSDLGVELTDKAGNVWRYQVGDTDPRNLEDKAKFEQAYEQAKNDGAYSIVVSSVVYEYTNVRPSMKNLISSSKAYEMMAEEMVEYSKNNILVQAGQSMLAQANLSLKVSSISGFLIFVKALHISSFSIKGLSNSMFSFV